MKQPFFFDYSGKLKSNQNFDIFNQEKISDQKLVAEICPMNPDVCGGDYNVLGNQDKCLGPLWIKVTRR